jgi:DNA-binding beta-propeller fold protein YncE
MRFAGAVRVLAPALGLLAAPPGYHVLATYTLGGPGGWDYVAFDTAGHRLFIARQTRVQVVDPETGKVLGEIPGMSRAHGIAFAYEFNHGFATSGTDSTITMFDLKTLQVLGKAKGQLDADAVLYDAPSKRVFSFNGDSKNATALDAQTGKVIANIDLGAGPEFGVAAGDGKLYVNLEESGEVAEIDAKTLKVTRKWAMGSCKGATGLAIDREHHRLFSGCNEPKPVMAIADYTAGKFIAAIPIGPGVDAAGFDPGTGYAFASSGGDGTLTVVHEDSPDKFSLAESVKTMLGARTMTVDPKTHKVYLISAKFTRADSTAANPHPRPRMVPDSFTLLVLGM